MSENPPQCPNCGAEVPPNAKACPGCGSCEETGWSEESTFQSLDLPGDPEEFDYDEFVKNEFSESGKPQLIPKGISPFWWIVALVVIAIFLSFVF